MQNTNPTVYIVAISILLVILLWQYKKTLLDKDKLLKEKDEKIQWLREIGAENDYRHAIKNNEIEDKLKEGIKNQVVAKIELEQAKRSKALERAGLKT